MARPSPEARSSIWAPAATFRSTCSRTDDPTGPVGLYVLHYGDIVHHRPDLVPDSHGGRAPRRWPPADDAVLRARRASAVGPACRRSALDARPLRSHSAVHRRPEPVTAGAFELGARRRSRDPSPAVPQCPRSTAGRDGRGHGRRSPSIAAVMASLFDAALLQRARAYFTGGFLSADHIQTLPQAVGFIGGSLLSDLGVVGIFAVVAQRFVSWLGLRDRLAVAVASAGGAASHRGERYRNLSSARLSRRCVRSGAHVRSRRPGRRRDLGGGVGPPDRGGWWLGRGDRCRNAGGSGGSATEAYGEERAAPAMARAMWLALVVFALATVSNVVLRSGSDVLDNGLRRKPSGQWLGTFANLVSDVDRDGYGVLGRPPDPNLFDSRIRPYAPDLPGNGVDEDGVGGDLPAGSPPYAESTAPAPLWRTKPDVVLIVLESFRADAVGAVHNGTPVTPVLDALAAEGRVGPPRLLAQRVYRAGTPPHLHRQHRQPARADHDRRRLRRQRVSDRVLLGPGRVLRRRREQHRVRSRGGGLRRARRPRPPLFDLHDGGQPCGAVSGGPRAA